MASKIKPFWGDALRRSEHLARPDRPTLPVAIYRVLGRPGEANFGQAMALAVILMVLTVVVVLGIAGYFQLGVDRFPKIDFPVVTVTTILPGASPVDVESDITDVIEGAVNTVGNIDELRSISSEGVSLVVAQFKLSVDPDIAAQDVRDRIDRVMSDLPEGTEPPVVSKIDPDASPIIYAALRSPGRPLREVTDMADNTVRHEIGRAHV